jgi:hypothetical protein
MTPLFAPIKQLLDRLNGEGEGEGLCWRMIKWDSPTKEGFDLVGNFFVSELDPMQLTALQLVNMDRPILVYFLNIKLSFNFDRLI